MKKIIFNVYRIDKAKHLAYMNEHPDVPWYQIPQEVYSIIKLEGYLLSPKDIAKEGFPLEKAQELYDKGIKFVVHHSFESYGDGISEWWKCSEYSTSASITHRNREKRYMSIFDLGVVLDFHWENIDVMLTKRQQAMGIINL